MPEIATRVPQLTIKQQAASQSASQPANSQTATTATTATNSNHQELTGRKHTQFKASVASAGVAKRLQF